MESFILKSINVVVAAIKTNKYLTLILKIIQSLDRF